jgi:hypothetical protein
MTDKVIYEKWENGEKVSPSGWQQIIITPKGEKKTVTENKIFENDTPLYPAKQWQGLTDDERKAIITELSGWSSDANNFDVAIWIEAKLKEKNT